MITITYDINEQTCIPGTCTACIASLYLLVYRRKHPQTLGYVSVYVRKKFQSFFSQHMPHISHLSFCVYPHPFSLFILLQYTTV